MPTRSQVGVLKTIDGRSSEGKFEIREVPKSERTRMALKWLAIFWAIAIVCIPVPPHVILAPSFFLLGPYIAYRVFQIRERIATGRADCPVCGKLVTFNEIRFRPRFKEICPKCANQLYVQF